MPAAHNSHSLDAFRKLRKATTANLKHRYDFAVSVESDISGRSTRDLAMLVGEAIARTYVHQILPRVAFSMFMCGLGWWAVDYLMKTGDITRDVKFGSMTFMVGTIGALQVFILVQWALRSMNRFWEARGHLGRVSGSLHLLAVQFALVQERCYKKGSDFAVSQHTVELYCGLLQSYLPLLIRKVHPTNRDEPLGWEDPRSGSSVDLLPAALTDHIAHEDVDDLLKQSYALLGHWLYMLIDELHTKEILDVAIAKPMYKNVVVLHRASMGVEKIKNTPIPELLKVGVTISTNFYAYLCFPMVLALRVQLDLDKWEDGWPKVIITTCMVFIYCVLIMLIFVLFVLGLHFEDPYGDDSYDLPLVRMVQNIHRDIQNVFHMGLEQEVPDAARPVQVSEGDGDLGDEGMRQRLVSPAVPLS